MAPSKFGDLNKTIKDLFADDFVYGSTKFTVKSKTSSGFNLKVEESRSLEAGNVDGALEVKYTNNAHGLSLKNTWNLKDSVAQETSFSPAALKGSKITLSNNLSHAGRCTGYKAKVEFSNDAVYTELVASQKDITSSSVFAAGAVSVGVSATYDLGNGALSKNALAATFADKKHKVHVALSDLSQLVAGVHLKHCASSETAVEAKYNFAKSTSDIALVHKCVHEKAATIKFSLNKSLQLGFSASHKLRDEVSLTLSAQVDLANCASAKNQLGAALTLDL